MQPQISPDIKFPCSLNGTRSATKPTNVNKLRPGDIDVIAAMGDSLTAGNGLRAFVFWNLITENRGISATIVKFNFLELLQTYKLHRTIISL